MGSGTFYPAIGGDDGWGNPPATFNNSSPGGLFGDFIGSNYRSFIRFPNVNIPKNSIITTAYIAFVCQSSGSVAMDAEVAFNASNNAVVPTSWAGLSGLSLTTVTPWASVPNWTIGVTYNSPSLIASLQEVVNTVGWLSGNAVMAVIYGASGAGNRLWRTYNFGSSFPALHVEWTEPETTFPYKDFELSWPLTYRIYEDFELMWNIGLFPVAANIAMNNNLTNAILKDLILKNAIIVSADYEIPIPIYTVDSTYVLKYDITATISRDFELKWSITVSSDFQLLNSLNIDIFKDFVVKIPIQMNVDWEIPITFSSEITKDWALRNYIEGEIRKAFEMKYGVEVSRSFVIKNSIQNTIDAMFVVKNHLLQNVNKDVELKFQILNYNPITVEFEMRNTLLGKPMHYRITFTD